MISFSPDQNEDTPVDVAQVATQIRHHDLELPAWAVLECIRPFSWLLGQACLVVQPLAEGVSWGHPLITTMRLLASPEQLAALSEALEPDREAN